MRHGFTSHNLKGSSLTYVLGFIFIVSIGALLGLEHMLLASKRSQFYLDGVQLINHLNSAKKILSKGADLESSFILLDEYSNSESTIDSYDFGLFNYTFLTTEKGMHILHSYLGAVPASRSDTLIGKLKLTDNNKRISLGVGVSFGGKAIIPKGKWKSSEKEAGLLRPRTFMAHYLRLDSSHPLKERHLYYDSIMNTPERFKFISTFFSDGVVLKGVLLNGDSLICSRVPLFFKRDSCTVGYVLVAPKISISVGQAGLIQAYAEDSLIVEENTMLKFPSVLSCYGVKKSSVRLKKNSEVKAYVFSGSSDYMNDLKSGVWVGENSRLLVDLHSSGFINLEKGVALFGNLIGDRINYVEDGIVRHDHFENCSINDRDYPGDFPMLSSIDSSYVVVINANELKRV